MLLKIIRKIFGIKEEKSVSVETFINRVEKKKKVRLKAGSEEWLKYADEFTKTEFYASQGRKEELKKAEYKRQEFDKVNKRLISFEMVPKQQASRNVRSYLEYVTGSFEKWAFIRNNEEQKAECKCIVCGGNSKDIGKSFFTECHEVWQYDNKTKNQKLLKLEALCTLCHKIKHIDQHITEKDEFDSLLQLYAVLNDITLEESMNDFNRNLSIRKSLDTTLFSVIDMSILKEYDIEENSFKCHSKEFNDYLTNVFKKKPQKNKEIKNEE